MQPRVQKYDNITVLLHWVIGIGIIALAGLELFRGEFPRGHFIREGLRPIHQPLGTLLFALIMIRVAWRVFGTRAPRDGHASGLAGYAATAVHLALYGLMVALPLLGMLYVFGNDKGIDFGAFTLALPLKASIGAYAKSFRSVHETLGIGILVLAFLHAAAALGHHYVLKDLILNRMRLTLRRDTDNDTDMPLAPAE